MGACWIPVCCRHNLFHILKRRVLSRPPPVHPKLSFVSMLCSTHPPICTSTFLFLVFLFFFIYRRMLNSLVLQAPPISYFGTQSTFPDATRSPETVVCFDSVFYTPSHLHFHISFSCVSFFLFIGACWIPLCCGHHIFYILERGIRPRPPPVHCRTQPIVHLRCCSYAPSQC